MAEYRPLDAERLAAFLEGRLRPDERDAVMSQLAHDAAARELLADAGAALAELGVEADGAPVTEVGTAASAATAPFASGDAMATGTATATPIAAAPSARPSAPRRWGPMLALAVAASVAVIVLVRRPPAPAGGPTPSPAAATQFALAPNDREALTRDRWTVVRSTTIPLDATARAVRLGALAVDAYLDREGTAADARAEMATLLEPVPGGGPARRLLADAADSAALAAGVEATRALMDGDAFDAGVTLESLRADPSGGGDRSLDAVERTLASTVLAQKRADEGRALLSQLRNHLAAGDRARIRSTADALLALLAG